MQRASIICHVDLTKVLVRSLSRLGNGFRLSLPMGSFTHSTKLLSDVAHEDVTHGGQFVFNPQHCMADGSPLGQGSPVLFTRLLPFCQGFWTWYYDKHP
jgi:hypothetical protein